MKKVFYYLSIVLLTITSCNKILNTTPKDFVAPVNYYSTENELESALAGVYDRLGDLRLYARGMASYMVFSDEFFMKGRTTGIEANVVNASTLDINRQWEALYTGIERANMLLGNIDNAMQVSEEKRNVIRGQALFLRAYYYFLLVDQYGSVPLKLDYSRSPDEEPLPASSLKDIYDQIVKDMKESATLVKSIADYSYNTRVTKTAVQGILARVYLKMAGFPLRDVSKYAEARTYADSVMKSGLHDLNPDFKQIYINHVREVFDIKENLLEVEFKERDGEIVEGGQIGSSNGITCATAACIPSVGYASDWVHATAKLYNAYATGDQRRDWTVAPFRFVTSGQTITPTNWSTTQIYDRSCGKWRREYETRLPKAQNNTSTNFPLLRYADVLLIYAEADNNINGGPSAQAYEAVNKVRRRGYGKNVAVPDVQADAPQGLAQQDFQDLIMNERLRELAFEGLRKHDLIRWGVYGSVMDAQARAYQLDMPTALRAPAIEQAQRTAEERRVLFPIPNSELSVNYNMKQNPGW